MPAPRYSRFEFATPYVGDADPTGEPGRIKGKLFLDVPDPPDKIVLRRGATRFTAGQGDTLWSIAWKAYKPMLDAEQDIRPSGFFFAIAWANDIVDPLAPILEGTNLFIPSVEVLLTEVLIPPPFYTRNQVS